MRKEIFVTISDESRDKGKVFKITEMPASQAEAWATKALLGLAASDVDLGDNVAGAGLAGVAVLGLRALGKMTYSDLKPLMDEMFECITVCPDKQNREVERHLVENDIEEVSTRLKLRSEVFELHTGFSLAGKFSKSMSQDKPAQQST